jgi:hypothetical protein
VFPHFEEIPDPTETDPRLKQWWEALQDHSGCQAAVSELDEALEKFLKYLMGRLGLSQ